jgi:Tfp pilus assembly protein PilZ
VTLDASRDGLSFQSKQTYSLGEPIHVAMHYRDGQEPIESPGCIVRVTPRGPRSEYGVKLG